MGVYKLPSLSDNGFTNRLSLIVNYYLPKYENIIFIGGFNLSAKNHYLDEMNQAYNLP